MRDCTNVMMRDLLPDLLHDRVESTQVAELRAHLAVCEDCRAELALLERVRDGAVTPRVNVAHIVGALPSYTSWSRWGRPLQSPLMRIAAVVLLLAGGAAVVVNARRESTTPPLSDTVQQVAEATPAELPVGETLQDLSDSDLRALLAELATLEAVTPSETEMVVVPAVPGSGS